MVLDGISSALIPRAGELNLDIGLPHGGGHTGFSGILDKAVGRVDDLQKKADEALKALASGEAVDLHGTMIALDQADIALRTSVTVRDKFIQAYETVMNMAV